MIRPKSTHIIAKLMILALASTLTACWGSKDSQLDAAANPAQIVDSRPVVQRVTSLEIEPIQEGVIIRATGLPPTQGWWNGELAPENLGQPKDGVMSYRFVLFPPENATRASTPQSREVTVAIFLSKIKLADVSTIVVAGQANSLTKAP